MTCPPARGPRPLLLALLLPLLVGCATPPSQSISNVYQSRIAYIEGKYTKYADFLAAGQSRVERNRAINDMLFLIDVNYQQQEGRLYGRKAYADFGAKAATLGLSAAGTVVGGTALPALLAATTGALTGSVTAFNSSVLQDQSILAITTNMRRLRLEKLVLIRASMQKGTDKYPIEEALVDLVGYYKAGTFVAALQDLVERTAAAKVEAQDTVDAQKLSDKGITELPK